MPFTILIVSLVFAASILIYFMIMYSHYSDIQHRAKTKLVNEISDVLENPENYTAEQVKQLLRDVRTHLNTQY